MDLVILGALIAAIAWQVRSVNREFDQARKESDAMWRAIIETQMARDGWVQDGNRWTKGNAIITMTWGDGQ